MKIEIEKKHLSIGITAFLVISASILLYIFLKDFSIFMSLVKKIFKILMPITLGLIFAYLINPLVLLFERKMCPKLYSKRKKLTRILGISFALIISLLGLTALISLILPEIISSFSKFINELPDNLSKFEGWINSNLSRNQFLQNFIPQDMDTLINQIQQGLSEIMPEINKVLGNITTSVIGVFIAIKDSVIGIIVSIYVLYNKEKFFSQIKKFLCAIFSVDNTNKFIEFFKQTDKIFGGFIMGKILDSIIIGIICFIGLVILKMPYAVLISVIIGVTNVIPFFGPFIGAIPSGLLILIIEPSKLIWFLIFILLLQQFDGNILGPKILGESTGLSAFWVIFAILLGGGLFGFAGMLIGVPAFAVIYSLIKVGIDNRLNKKGLPVNTKYYTQEKFQDINN